jgi:recombination protein RecT
MPINNSLTQSVNRPMTFAEIANTPECQADIRNSIKDPKKADEFTTAVIQVVSNNSKLTQCYPNTIISAALTGVSLGLSASPQLGQFYVVPYKQTASFQIGYKGLIQLAIRSGNYKKLNVLPVKQGELIRFDPFNEEIEVNVISDPDEREKAPTVGYYATFTYLNGFKKAIYWSREKMNSHAKKYSRGYDSFWAKDFDSMACKTMLRQLITKWGIMSTEMQTAISKDIEYNDIAAGNTNESTGYQTATAEVIQETESFEDLMEV